MEPLPIFNTTYIHPFVAQPPTAPYIWQWDEELPLTGMLCVGYIAYGLFTTWIGSLIVKASKFDDPRLNVRLAFELGACIQFVSWLLFVTGIIPLPSWALYGLLWAREFFDMVFFQLAAGQFSEHYIGFLHRHHLFSLIGRVTIQTCILFFLGTNELVNWGGRTIVAYYCCSICPVMTEPVDRMWLVNQSDDVRVAVRGFWFVASRVTHLTASYWLTIIGSPYVAPESLIWWYLILGAVVVLNEANSVIFGLRSCCAGQARRRASSISTTGKFGDASPSPQSSPAPSPNGVARSPQLRERRTANGSGSNGKHTTGGVAAPESPAGVIKKIKKRMVPPPISPLMRPNARSFAARSADKEKAKEAAKKNAKPTIVTAAPKVADKVADKGETVVVPGSPSRPFTPNMTPFVEGSE